MRLLILGGTADAKQFCKCLLAAAPANTIEVIYSIAGLVRQPQLPCEVISGGFSQYGGLANFIKEQRVEYLVDLTHPYAQKMSQTAAHVSKRLAIPFWCYNRPAWQPAPNDNWQTGDWHTILEAILPYERIFLAAGQLPNHVQEQLASEVHAHQQLLIRTAVAAKLNKICDNMRFIEAIGPFTFLHEQQLLAAHNIQCIVCKNSGGDSSVEKLHAARAMGIPVKLLSRPRPVTAPQWQSLDELLTDVLRAITQNTI